MIAQADPPVSFLSEQAIHDWAERSSYGGSSVHALTYKQKQLLVVNRNFGSGLHNSRPTVFVKTHKGWLMVLESDTTYPLGFDYQIREGFLEIYSRNENKSIDIRFNLELLP
jgi:hypothetical protein